MFKIIAQGQQQGGSVPDFGHLTGSNKSYNPEVMNMIKRFIQSASGGNMSYSSKYFILTNRLPSKFI